MHARRQNDFLVWRLAYSRARNPWNSDAANAGREVAHLRHTGDHEVCESLESLLTDSQSSLASCVTGRRSNQLNYAPALLQRFYEITAGAFPCASITRSS
jgi:hypothetical protein